MIVEINKTVTIKNEFEVSASGNTFCISIGNESGHKILFVTREELELISKAIKEELEKAGK